MSEEHGLRKRKCANHASREAVARCPECKKDFCRECITEHNNKMLCTNCLQEITRKKDAKKKKLAALFTIVLFFLGMLISYYFFLGVASMLSEMPDQFHNGEFLK
jgi:uncharacterized paraquat-inducible protein A